MSDVRHLVLASALALAGCLVTPEPNGPTAMTPDSGGAEDDVGEADDMGAVQNDSGDDRDSGTDVVCDGCTVDARQCAEDAAGNAILQVCRATEAGAGCTAWLTAETCVGAQECLPSSGCTCTGDDVCVLGEAPDCPTNGLTVCVVLDGCPRALDIGREADCEPPDSNALPGCDEDSDAAWCNSCDNGRECVRSCDNAQGYSCGSPGEGF